MNEEIRQDLEWLEGKDPNVAQGPDGPEYGVYSDTKGNPTTGYGANLNDAHNQHVLDQLGYDPQSVISGEQTISEHAVTSLLDQGIETATEDAPTFVQNFDSLDPHAQMAVIEMDYNMGHGGLNGDNNHYGFPALQEALLNEDYAAAANEVHSSDVGEERNDHLWYLMEQAEIHHNDLPDVNLDVNPIEWTGWASSPTIEEQLQHPDVWFVHEPFTYEEPPATLSPPLSDVIPLPELLQNSDFGSGVASYENHSDAANAAAPEVAWAAPTPSIFDSVHSAFESTPSWGGNDSWGGHNDSTYDSWGDHDSGSSHDSGSHHDSGTGLVDN